MRIMYNMQCVFENLNQLQNGMEYWEKWQRLYVLWATII